MSELLGIATSIGEVKGAVGRLEGTMESVDKELKKINGSQASQWKAINFNTKFRYVLLGVTMAMICFIGWLKIDVSKLAGLVGQ